MNNLRPWRLGGLVSLSLLPLLTEAGGVSLTENSASGLGNAYAGSGAVAEDASTLAFNPAGMTLLRGSQMVVAGHYISPWAQFNEEGSTDGFGNPLQGDEADAGVDTIIPNFYYVTELDNQWRLGLAMRAPFGTNTEYDDGWVGRYHTINTSLTTINFTPSIAYRHSDNLSLGAGVSAQFLGVSMSSAIDFGALCLTQELVTVLPTGTCNTMGLVPQQSDGYADISGNNWSYGWNAGLLFSPSPRQRIGLSYHSAVVQEVSGDADFSVPGEAAFLATSSGAFSDTGASARVTFPASASISYWQQLNDTMALLADATWSNWAVFDELRIEFDNPNQPDAVTTWNWRDSWRYALGLNYRYNDTLLLRAGAALDQAVVTDEIYRHPRAPDGERRWLSFGAQYKVSDETTINAGYTRLFVEALGIDNTLEGTIPTLQANLKGNIEVSVNIFSLQLTRNF